MNRRLPRFLILVVQLIAMVGVLSLGSASPVGTSLAQEGQANPCSFTQSTPASGSGVQVPDTERIDLDGTDTGAFVQVLTVPADETVSFDARPNALIWVDDGEVTLTVCEGDRVAAEAGDSQELQFLEAGTTLLQTGNSVYVISGATVHLTGVAPESRIILMVVVPPSPGLCGGGGC